MSADTPSTDPVQEETIVVSDTPVGHSGTNVDVMEKPAWTMGSGAAIAAILVSLALTVGSVVAVIAKAAQEDAERSSGQINMTLIGLGILGVVMGTLVAGMIKVNSPGHTQVIQLFGRYLGTNRRTGLSLVPPLTNAKKVSVRVRNFETNEIKVNDLNGNPVVIGAIVVWQVADTAKATFAVEDMKEFIYSQSESALRHVATTHPYDSTNIDTVPSLSGSTDLVSQELADEVAARVAVAGLDSVEARISALQRPRPRAGSAAASAGNRDCRRPRNHRRRCRHHGRKRSGQAGRTRHRGPRFRAPRIHGVQPPCGSLLRFLYPTRSEHRQPLHLNHNAQKKCAPPPRPGDLRRDRPVGWGQHAQRQRPNRGDAAR